LCGRRRRDTINYSSRRLFIRSFVRLFAPASRLRRSTSDQPAVVAAGPEVIRDACSHGDASPWRHGGDDDDGDDVGRREPRGAERRRHPSRDVQGDAEEDPGHAAVAAHRGARQLRPDTQRVLLRQTSGRLRADTQLLPHREAALPDRRVRSALRGRARLLGTRCQPGTSTAIFVERFVMSGSFLKRSGMAESESESSFICHYVRTQLNIYSTMT